MPSYGRSVLLPGLDADAAVAKVTEALAAEGFGVLTTIDAQAVFAKKLGIDHRPYRILGACNPHLARRAIELDPQVGLLLPCNVLVQGAEGGSEVSILDPFAMLSFNEALRPVAEDAAARLERVRGALGA